jgi:hypothetical protein
MPRSRRTIFWRSLAHRACAVWTLVAYVATAIGLPLPIIPTKDRSRPYPCQNHLCGCRTADDCARYCCCFSSEERRSWAQAHHVELPEPPAVNSAQGWNNVRLRDQETSCSHCAKEESKKSCTAGHPLCCTEKQQVRSGPPTRNAGQSPCRHSGGSPGFTALKCQGPSTLWISVGTVPPPSSAVAWKPCRIAAETLVFADIFAPNISLDLLDPPPRLKG